MRKAKKSTNFQRLWLWLSDQGNWERFSAADNAEIEQTLRMGNHGVILERNRTSYFLDLSRRTQTNGCTGRMRPIRPIHRGAHWLVEDANDSTVLHTYFSEPELEELEKALFFSKQDGYILQRGDETHYVDLAKWTVTNLSTGATGNIHVSSNQDIPPQSISSEEGEVTKEQHHLMGTNESDCSETYTSESSSEDSEETKSSVLAVVQKSHTPGKWRWENDSDSWSTFDDDIAAAIEETWESGAAEMMFQRGSEVYFVDLQSLTQINVSTGFTRAIERVEPVHPSGSVSRAA